MKTEVRKASDLNETGNKKIKLKRWMEKMLALMSPDDPTIKCIPGKFSSFT